MKISISNISVTYPTKKKALKNIDASIESPNLIGLIGPNGAGKSTLIKLLTCGMFPTEGKITIDGQPLFKKEQEFKSRLGYLPQIFGLYDELTVFQFLDYIAILKGVEKRKNAIQCVMEDTNLIEKSKSRIKTLSGGQRQRVGIAQALLGNSDFLIFDEPTVGLDPEERIHFRNLFSQRAQDKLVLLSTHIIEDVQSVCNRLIVLDKGSILFTGTPEELITLAQGHVGVFENQLDVRQDCEIISRINTANGVIFKGVAEQLPDLAKKVEPTLEDAYIYLMIKEGRKI